MIMCEVGGRADLIRGKICRLHERVQGENTYSTAKVFMRWTAPDLSRLENVKAM